MLKIWTCTVLVTIDISSHKDWVARYLLVSHHVNSNTISHNEWVGGIKDPSAAVCAKQKLA